MKWLDLAATDFDDALAQSEGVAIIPVGSIEIHGPHLPVGCDTLVIDGLINMVEEREPVVVAPTLAYTMAPYSRLHPGGISMPPELLVNQVQCICDELAANGFGTIVLVHGHGGNVAMHQMSLWTAVDRAKTFALYSVPPLAGAGETMAKVLETKENGHACEMETSVALAIFPERVHMDRVFKVYTRQTDLDVGPAATSADWAAHYPEYCVGDASKATAEKGKAILEAWADAVADVVRKVKKDTVVASVMAKLSGQPVPRWKRG